MSVQISLVIPVYNRPEMITDCLQSLVPSLPNLSEIIVVDDGSTDGRTPDSIRQTISHLGASDKIRLIEQPNGGPGAARNTGAQAAVGDWVAFLDSDDLWLPWSGKALIDVISRHQEAVAVFEHARPFAELAEIADWTESGPHETVHDGFYDMAAHQPRVIRIGSGYFAMRRALFQTTGGFEVGLRGSEDTDLFYRMAEAGPFVALSEPVMIARRTGSDDSLTLNMGALSEGLYFLLRSHWSGRYGAPNSGRTFALADLLAFWLHALFWGGWGREAYDLLLRQGGFRILIRGGRQIAALKLLFIPILSILRPRSYRFRWRPKSV